MRFLSCTRGFYGSNNDKTICKFDKLTNDIKNGVLFAENEFTVYNSEGIPETLNGNYLICDGGFCKWRCLMTCITVTCMSIYGAAKWKVQEKMQFCKQRIMPWLIQS